MPGTYENGKWIWNMAETSNSFFKKIYKKK